MAIALKPTPKRSRPTGPEWRGIALVLALALILVGVALSGGFNLPSSPEAAGDRIAPMTPQGPALDGRGKWTGY